jgi:hypothetical protein
VPAPESYLRVAEEKDTFIALEVAARQFRMAAGDGPVIWLVGVAHIGDRSFYRSLQELLASTDRVLYESVMPPGAGRAGGDTDEDRAAATRAGIRFLASVAELHRARTGGCLRNAADLEAFAATLDARLGQWVREAMMDGWGRPLEWSVSPEATALIIVSRGSDGAAGGEGAAADVDSTAMGPIAPLDLPSDDGIQGELAAALGLAFQLNAIDYNRPGWHCSDMTMDELDRELRKRGADFELLGGTLAGTSFPARFATVMLRLIRLADAFTQGAISDLMKVLMIELLGDASVVEAGLGQLGGPFKEVIVDGRNQVVVDDLRSMVAREPVVGSIAVLYGAAHLEDLERRIGEQLGYRPAESRWFRAIEVDLARSQLDARQLAQMRLTMRRMLQQQMKAMRGRGN